MDVSRRADVLELRLQGHQPLGSWEVRMPEQVGLRTSQEGEVFLSHVVHDDRPGAGYPEDGFEWGPDDPAKDTPYETGPRKGKNESCPEKALYSVMQLTAYIMRLFR